jgi:hypothetical protein
MSFLVGAQEKVKQEEVGLVFSSLNAFGLTFKTGTNKSLWRFQTLIISGINKKETNENLVWKQSNNGFGLAIGKEFRNIIIENLEFRYGVDLAFNYSKNTDDRDYEPGVSVDRMTETTSYQPGIKFILGLNYVFNDKFVIGVELLPAIYYISEKEKEKVGNSDEVITDVSGFDYRIANNFALLTLAFRF